MDIPTPLRDPIGFPLCAAWVGALFWSLRHLTRTGEGYGGRALGLMSEVDLSHFTDGEIDAVHTYLTAP